MNISLTTDNILQLLPESTLEGQYTSKVSSIAALSTATTHDLSFLGNIKYTAQVEHSLASIIIVPNSYAGHPKNNQAYIRVQNPSMALASICLSLEKSLFPSPQPSIHPTAVIDPTATIAPSAHIGPYCCIGAHSIIGNNTVLKSHIHIGNHVTIGNDSFLMPQVSILDYCVVGNHVRLHAGTVIGSDGYGYETIQGQHIKVPQIGHVIIEDNVEIGANTTIDRARFGKTRIGQGTKIDNLVQIAHNADIGKHCLLVAQGGISGSTTLEDYVVTGGQVGIAGHIKIGKGSQIAAQSGVHTDVEAGTKLFGSPAYPFMFSMKLEALKKELPALFKRVKNLENKAEKD